LKRCDAQKAREHYITKTRQTVHQNLDDAGLPRKSLYHFQDSLAKIAKVLRSKETKLEMRGLVHHRRIATDE